MDIGDYYLHRVIAAWLQVGAVVVAGVALAVSMRRARVERRADLASAAYEGMARFIEIGARNPALGLLESQEGARRQISPENREIGRAAYLLLLLTYERMYRHARWTKQPHRLATMRQMIAAYAGVPLFQEACRLFTSMSDDDFAQHLARVLQDSDSQDVRS